MPSGGNPNFPEQSGSGAGGGLFTSAPPELMQPSVWSVYHNDFLTAADFDTTNDWVVTNITTGTADLVQDVATGIVRLENTVANQGLGSVQFTGANTASEGIAVPAAGRTIIYECRATIDDWSDCDWYIGLGETDTTFMDAAGLITANGGDNHVGFTHLEAGTGIPILTVAGNAVANVESDVADFTSTGQAAVVLTDSTYYRFGIRIDGTDRVRFFIDGVAVTNWHTMGVAFNDAMTITFAMISAGNAIDVDLDYITVAQTR